MFDRTTGKPMWPIEERPVEKGDVPGEWYSPTQPFVTKPPPFDRQGVSARRSDRLHAGAPRRSAEVRIALQDRSDLHAARRQQCGRSARHAHLPSNTGGANWQGGALDPETKRLYVFSATQRSAARSRAGRSGARSDFGYVCGHRRDVRRHRRRVGARRASEGGGTQPARQRPRSGPAAEPRPRAAAAVRLRADAAKAAARSPYRGCRSLKPPYGHIAALRHEQGRSALEHRARRHAGQHQESRGAQRRDDSEDRDGRAASACS